MATCCHMGIDKPGGCSDAAPDRPDRPDRPREPEHPVPRRENPAARDRPPSRDQDAPVARPDRVADAEAHRLARLARRADRPPPEPAREPRPGDQGVITHFHGPTVDLYTDGKNWASGDVVRAREAERQRQQARPDLPSMRDHGRDVIGDKPDNASDLPPDRRELMESGDSKRSRADRLRQRLGDKEFFSDTRDTVNDQTNMMQRLLDARQPQGHPMQVQRDTPHAGPVQHGQPSAGNIAVTGLVCGIMLDRSVRYVHDKLTRKKEVD